MSDQRTMGRGRGPSGRGRSTGSPTADGGGAFPQRGGGMGGGGYGMQQQQMPQQSYGNNAPPMMGGGGGYGGGMPQQQQQGMPGMYGNAGHANPMYDPHAQQQQQQQQGGGNMGGNDGGYGGGNMQQQRGYGGGGGGNMGMQQPMQQQQMRQPQQPQQQRGYDGSMQVGGMPGGQQFPMPGMQQPMMPQMPQMGNMGMPGYNNGNNGGGDGGYGGMQGMPQQQPMGQMPPQQQQDYGMQQGRGYNPQQQQQSGRQSQQPQQHQQQQRGGYQQQGDMGSGSGMRQANFMPGSGAGLGPGNGYQPSYPSQPGMDDSLDDRQQGGQRSSTRRNQPYARPVESPDPEGSTTPQQQTQPSPKVMGRGRGRGQQSPQPTPASNDAGDGGGYSEPGSFGPGSFPNDPQRAMGGRGRGSTQYSMSEPNTPHFDGLQAGGGGTYNQQPQQPQQLHGGYGGYNQQQQQPPRSPGGMDNAYGGMGDMQQQRHGRGGGPRQQPQQQMPMQPQFGMPQQQQQQPQQQGFSQRHGRGGGMQPQGGLQMPPMHGSPNDVVGSPLYASGGSGGGGLRVGGGPQDYSGGGNRGADVAGPRLRVGGGGGGGGDYQQQGGPNGGRMMPQQPPTPQGMYQQGTPGQMQMSQQQHPGQQQQRGNRQHRDPSDQQQYGGGGYNTPGGHGGMPPMQPSPNSMQTYGGPNNNPQQQYQQQQQRQQPPPQQQQQGYQQSPGYAQPQQHPGRMSAGPYDDASSNGNDLRGMPVHIGLSATHGQQQQHRDGPGVRVGPAPPPDVSVGVRSGAASQQPQPHGGRGRGGGFNGPRHGASSSSPQGGETHDFHGNTPGSISGGVPPVTVGGGLSVVVGKHAGAAVQRGAVIDATQAPPKADSGDAEALSRAGSGILLPAEYNWMRDIQQSSSAAMLFSTGAVFAQQCPRSGLLHMLYLLADRHVEAHSPDTIRDVLLEVAQEAPKGSDGPRFASQWEALLPAPREYAFFKVAEVKDVATAKNTSSLASSQAATAESSVSSSVAELLNAKPSRSGMRPMLVDGDLFLANALRALHAQDAKWFLVSEAPDMVLDICTVAATALFTSNGIDPRFIFSGVPGAECDTDAVQTTATLLKQQDTAWDALKEAWDASLSAARKRFTGGGNSNPHEHSDRDSPRNSKPLKCAGSIASLCSFVNDDPLDGPLRSGFASRTELHAPITEAMREAVMQHLGSGLGFEVIRAPQLAWAQAASIIAAARAADAKANPTGEEPSTVPPFYAAPEALLLEGIESIVLALDGNGRCLTVDKASLLDALYVRNSASIRRKAADGAATASGPGQSPSTNASGKMELGEDVGSAESESDGEDYQRGAAADTNGSTGAVQSPDVTNSIAATLTQAEKTFAFVDFGLLTTTHPQLAAFTVKTSQAAIGQGMEFLRAFNYRTLVPFGTKAEDFVGLSGNATVKASPEDANQPEDCDAALKQWIADESSKSVSGFGRYRVDRLIAAMVEGTNSSLDASRGALTRGDSGHSLMSMSGAVAAAAPSSASGKRATPQSNAHIEAITLRHTRKAKWRLMRGRAFLKHGPVVAPAYVPATVEDGNTDPDVTVLSRVLAVATGKPATFAHLDVPMNLKDVCGAQIPGILQFAHVVGAIRSSTLTVYAHLYDKTERPHVDSYLIRRCLTKCTSVLCALAFEELVGAMSATSADVELHVGDGLTPTSWVMPSRGRRARFSRADLDDWPLSRFDELAATANPADLPIDLHSVLYLSTKGVSPRPDRDAPPAIQASALYHNRRQFVAAVHLKLLDFLGYFVHPDPIECELGMYGKALARFPSSLNIMIDTYGQPNPINHAVTRQITGSYAQQVILLIELLRTESLTAKEVVYVTSSNWDSTRRLPGGGTAGVVMAAETEPNATLPTKPDRAAVLLGSRVACLCPMKLHGPWTGFLDREIAGFASITSHLQHSLRRVADVLAASMLVSGRYTGAPEDLTEVGAELPMSTNPTAAAGCLMRFILESSDDFGLGLATPDERLGYVAAVFPCLLAESVRREAAAGAPTKTPKGGVAANTNPLSAEEDGSSVASSSRHTASCVEGCPDDADIDYRHAAVIKHMDGVLGEVFGFWDIAYHVVMSLKDLALEEAEREDGEHVRGIPDDLLTTFRHTNEIMMAKRDLFGIRIIADDDDEITVDVGVPLPN